MASREVFTTGTQYTLNNPQNVANRMKPLQTEKITALPVKNSSPTSATKSKNPVPVTSQQGKLPFVSKTPPVKKPSESLVSTTLPSAKVSRKLFVEPTIESIEEDDDFLAELAEKEHQLEHKQRNAVQQVQQSSQQNGWILDSTLLEASKESLSVNRLPFEVTESQVYLDSKDRIVRLFPLGISWHREESPTAQGIPPTASTTLKKRKNSTELEANETVANHTKGRETSKRRRTLPPLLSTEERLPWKINLIPEDILNTKPVILIGAASIGKRHFACSHLNNPRVVQQTSKDLVPQGEQDNCDGYVFTGWVSGGHISEDKMHKLFDLKQKVLFRQTSKKTITEITVLEPHRPRLFLGTDLMDAIGFKSGTSNEKAEKMLSQIIPLCYVLNLGQEKLYEEHHRAANASTLLSLPNRICSFCEEEATLDLQAPLPTKVCEVHHRMYGNYAKLPTEQQRRLLNQFVQSMKETL